ncbi:MAG: DUF3482 domain-containing protein, partial [Algiphilus sp.]
AAGMGVDLLSGGLSLGTGTLVGAAVGALFGVGDDLGRATLDRLRGQHTLVIAFETLQVLAVRQLQLLAALLRRGHASQRAILLAEDAGVFPAIDRLLRRARAHPEWSRLNDRDGASSAATRARHQLAVALEASLPQQAAARPGEEAVNASDGTVQYGPTSESTSRQRAFHDK